ncbi:hypothetical protein [Fervidibacillus halotolerans]|uniref:Uncharacterized protein n=1 Tax=Fervidibacillus halotolerans TaxID=2980027 RepID=A0A9E8M0G4_9BACI|nr:hypothetical protein [Fervidibacillus halotolerans]WAA12650.1 hypothetical protein OE105_00450 [Fervidibacillus halotolerans]
MHYFFKLNVVSVFIAFLYFLNAELLINSYRIWILENYDDIFDDYIYPTKYLILLLSLVSLFFIIKKWLHGRMGNFWIMLLWVPYAIMLMRLFIIFFPLGDGEDPGPGFGFYMLFEFLMYQMFLFFTIMLSNAFSKNTFDKVSG